MELIQISKTVIGNGTVNAVNARELYNSLGLAKGQYSRWIQSNLVDIFRYNDDYIGVRQDVEGNEVMSHIVTLDTAKHLCMMAKTPGAMKYRQYFIDIEKKAQAPLTPSEQIHLLAQGYTQIEQTLNEVKADIETLKNDIVLTPAQKRALQNAVSSRVYGFAGDKAIHSILFKRIYKALKDRFTVSSYMEIRRLDYEEAKSFIDRLSLLDLVVGF